MPNLLRILHRKRKKHLASWQILGYNNRESLKGEYAHTMKHLSLFVWLTQLGLSVAMPPVVSIWLAVWLHNSKGWGSWVIWVGILLGVVCAVDGLRVSLKALERITRPKDKKEPPPVSFNDHH